MSAKRFRIAFSFAGEKRDFVAEVAAILAGRFSEEKILYDKYHEAEFARARLGRYLPKLYHEQADLVVVVICEDYSQKEWPGLEWDAVFDLIKKRKEAEVMLCRFDHATVEGLFSDAGYVGLDDKTPEQAARLILQRLALNEGNPKDHFITESSTPAITTQLINVHLHPDFRVELGGLLEVWNSDQTRLVFNTFRPPHDIESFLLSRDPIEGIVTQELGMRLRAAASFAEQDGIFLFCEGRLFGDGYYQLFSWTTRGDNDRLDASTISLFIKRKLIESGQVKASLFTLVVQSMLYALGSTYDLPQHAVTRTCVMDFNNDMPDMLLGLDYGPKFCPSCDRLCRELGNEHLLALAASAKLRVQQDAVTVKPR
jgi:hypothetical protein